MAAIDREHASNAPAITSSPVNFTPVSQIFQPPLSTVSHLPAEILAIIFEASIDEPGDPSILKALPLGQVSRFWRNVALHTRSLWTKIDLLHKGSANFAARSSPLPIHLYLVHSLEGNLDQDFQLDALGWLPGNTDRVQTLCVCSSAANIAAISSALGAKSPNLIHLDIVCTMNSPIDDQPAIFDTHSPSLKRLELYSVCTNLSWCSNLVNLTIEGILPGDKYCPTASQFLSLLSRSSSLQTLSLRNTILDDLPDNQYKSKTLVTMPNLTSLELETGIESTIFLLQNLHIPLETPLFKGHESNRSYGLGSVLDGPNFTLEIDVIVGSIFFRGGDEQSTIWIAGDFINDDTINEIIAPPLDLSPTQNLAIAGFKAGDPSFFAVPIETWRILFGALPSLETIRLTGWGGWMENILRALFPANDAGDIIVCPRLKNLHLDFIQLDVGSGRWADARHTGKFILDLLEAGVRCKRDRLHTLDVVLVNDFGDSITEHIQSLVDVLILRV